ncbi:hypothetical protein DFS33DRAFT_1432964 [Desarmillaria ectypa]|nr:hypothetical protein DFS33DRAFT_1432964 [Desarmillaria ectypa]
MSSTAFFDQLLMDRDNDVAAGGKTLNLSSPEQIFLVIQSVMALSTSGYDTDDHILAIVMMGCYAIGGLFLNNFILKWHPNTLDTDVKRRGFTRPWVYLIGFKATVDFPENSTPEERVVTGCLLPLDSHGRPVHPNFKSRIHTTPSP